MIWDSRLITGLQIRAARSLLRITAAELAVLAGIGTATVRRAELEDGAVTMTSANLAAVRRALDEAGIIFIDAEEGVNGPGVALKWGVKTMPSQQISYEQDALPDPTKLALSRDLNPHVIGPSANLLQYWLSHPEEWLSLQTESRMAILDELGLLD